MKNKLWALMRLGMNVGQHQGTSMEFHHKKQAEDYLKDILQDFERLTAMEARLLEAIAVRDIPHPLTDRFLEVLMEIRDGDK
jgi:hypothetical protein